MVLAVSAASCGARHRRRRGRLCEQAVQQAAPAEWWSGWSWKSPVSVRTRSCVAGEIRLIRRVSYSHSQGCTMTDRPKCPDFLTKAAPAGPLDRARRRDSGGCCSGFGEGRRAAFHHGAGGRKGRRQRRIAVSVFPEQGGDPVPAPERRMAADQRPAARHPRGREQAAARTAARPWSTPSSVRNATRPRCAWRSMTPRRCIARRRRREEAKRSGERVVQAFMREALPEASDATRALAGDLIKTTLSAVGKTVFGKPSHRRRDRSLCRRHGRHVLCLSERSRQGLRQLGHRVRRCRGLNRATDERCGSHRVTAGA